MFLKMSLDFSLEWWKIMTNATVKRQKCESLFLIACEVSFDNVPVPVENVIGEVGGGFKVKVKLDKAN